MKESRPWLLGLSLSLMATACSLRSLDALSEGADRDGAVQTTDDAEAVDVREGAAPPNDPTRGDARTAEPEVGRDDAATPDTPDAGQTESDAGGSTPVDGGEQDGGTRTDPADAGTLPAWCPDTAVLCDDFERGPLSPGPDAVRMPWTWLQQMGNLGSDAARLVDDGPKPGARSFRSALGDHDSEQGIQLMKSLSVDIETIRMEFDFLPLLGKDDPHNNHLQIAKLQQRVGDAYPGISLEVRGDGVYAVVKNVIDGKWQTTLFERISALNTRSVRVRFDAVLGKSGSVRIALDGVTQLERSGFRVGSPDPDDTHFALGLYSVGALACSVVYDDVVLEVTD